MVKMFSLKESCLLSVIKVVAAIFRIIPYSLALLLARGVGRLCYVLLSKKRRVIYGNLKTAFSSSQTPQKLNRLTQQVFLSVAQSFVDVMCLPKFKKQGYERYVECPDRAYLENALKQNKGAIFLGIHSGSWEMNSLVGGSLNSAYNFVANEHSKVPQIDALLNEYRRIAGATIIAPGTGVTRDIIRALQNKKSVILVLDQGGRDGLPVGFMGRTASMSTGALRLGLKYKIPIYPVWITRKSTGQNILRVLKPLNIEDLEDSPEGIKQALMRSVPVFENLLKEHPHEYLWSYKVYKYSTQSRILIVDDGKTGHLRQSQAAAIKLSDVLKSRGKSVTIKSVVVQFKSPWKAKLFSVYTFIVAACGLNANESELSFFLTEETAKNLFKEQGDWIISCGSLAGGINFFLKRCFEVRSICILKAGLVNWKHFDLVITPQHDQRVGMRFKNIVFTKAALNLVSASYLKEQQGLLLNQYSHLKNNVRFKIGILLGGNTKGVEFEEGLIRSLLGKVKEAATHYNADILITTSRRTPPEIDAAVSRELKNFDRTALCIIANANNSPHAVGGILSLCDLLIVSGESISMVSEALSSGKRTIVFRPSGSYGDQDGLNKFDRFVLGLSDQGFILACSIKEVSDAIVKMMRNKLSMKTLKDNVLVEEAFEKII